MQPITHSALGLGVVSPHMMLLWYSALLRTGNRQGDMLFKYLRQVAAAEGTCASVSQHNSSTSSLAMSRAQLEQFTRRDETRRRWAKPEQL